MNQPKLTETTANKLMHGSAHVSAMMPPSPVAVDMSKIPDRGKDALKPEKVCIIGTATSSKMLAPYSDPSWTIWGTSPGNSGDPGVPNALPRLADAWIEMHANFLWPEYRQLYGEAYVKWLGEKQFPVAAPIDIPQYKALFPRATQFPWRELVMEFGPYFFTSTFAWAMAYAIHQGVKEISLYGVDMSSKDEYIQQRPGGQYFIMMALGRGIRVSIPDESDLLQPPPLYGIHDSTPMGRKAASRKQEILGRIAQCDQALAQAGAQKTYLQGALEDLEYHSAIWGGHSVRAIAQQVIDKAVAG